MTHEIMTSKEYENYVKTTDGAEPLGFVAWLDAYYLICDAEEPEECAAWDSNLEDQLERNDYEIRGMR